MKRTKNVLVFGSMPEDFRDNQIHRTRLNYLNIYSDSDSNKSDNKLIAKILLGALSVPVIIFIAHILSLV